MSVPDDTHLTEGEKSRVVQNLKAALADEAAKAAKRGSMNDEQRDAEVYNNIKKELLQSMAAESVKGSGAVRRKSDKGTAASAASTAANSPAAKSDKDSGKGPRKASSVAGRKTSQTGLSVSTAKANSDAAATAAAGKALTDSLSAPVPTVTPKSQQEFRKRRLSYAAQKGHSSNMLPMDSSSSTVYQSHEMGEADAVDKPLPLPAAVLGTYSCHGIEPAWEVINASRKQNVIFKIISSDMCTVVRFAVLTVGNAYTYCCDYDSSHTKLS